MQRLWLTCCQASAWTATTCSWPCCVMASTLTIRKVSSLQHILPYCFHDAMKCSHHYDH
ncbi:hypothetical protein PR002_g30444 [Phytophthora rubi]|uniref:Secreted protein n=1 Tax=Phytophthora rubi TaxID=129364 RepID=A0A6A3GRH7_9STRA|nr:hypothetical protein PF003_g13993 [Phytophthora fragariae]KAE8903025.1 hypothetical protein PF003_g12833 [Phytophthora fragariae]KAE8907280.1 hypothetical protein PF003_g8883 [Phytophthora fragariae]KAE8959736.1 hypothetical protein PR002_g30444 [Phytophthora rubi]